MPTASARLLVPSVRWCRLPVAGVRWSGVTSVATTADARRRGVATAVLAALAGWSAGQGAASMYLQVLASNAPAVALYERLGFVHHHDYVYRTAPGTRP